MNKDALEKNEEAAGLGGSGGEEGDQQWQIKAVNLPAGFAGDAFPREPSAPQTANAPALPTCLHTESLPVLPLPCSVYLGTTNPDFFGAGKAACHSGDAGCVPGWAQEGGEAAPSLPAPSPDTSQPLLPPHPSFASSPGKRFTGKNLCQAYFQHFGFNELTAARGLVSRGHQPSLWKVGTGTWWSWWAHPRTGSPVLLGDDVLPRIWGSCSLRVSRREDHRSINLRGTLPFPKWQSSTGEDKAGAYIQVLGPATTWDLRCWSSQSNCNRLLFSEDSAVGNAFAVISLPFSFHFLGALSLSLAINYDSW